MHVSEKNSDLVYIAAADCTGHGVPGALVSVVCSNALDRAVKEFRLTEPGKILDKVRELVVETFARQNTNEATATEVKDGMDISLCLLNTKTKEIQWAGANNPLWYIEEGQMKEIKANKQPIGKIDLPYPFTTHSIPLKSGDKLYLFSDGYADQFGGDKGKKFKYKNLKEMIFSNSQLDMDQQKELLSTTIEKWKGNLEQIDDILVIGIKI
jgi:serine phosphatase RsbU (regulator of sigma subunit)